uniref:Uncharacterized protein n=1 Tax=Arundo donax TaxID=35708 RepID=A0A0A9ARJ7_ARUDO
MLQFVQTLLAGVA